MLRSDFINIWIAAQLGYKYMNNAPAPDGCYRFEISTNPDGMKQSSDLYHEGSRDHRQQDDYVYNVGRTKYILRANPIVRDGGFKM